MKSKRGLFVLGLLGFCLMLAVASPAFATTRKTRITGLNTSITTSTYKDTGRVTYTKSGHWYSVSRAVVNVYRYIGGHWVLHTHIHANTSGSFNVSEPAGYTYKFAYAGKSHYYYSTYAKTVVNKPVVQVETAVAKWGPYDGYTTQPSNTAVVCGGLRIGKDLEGAPIVGATLSILKKDSAGNYAPFTTVVTTTNFIFEDISDSNWTVTLGVGEYKVVYAGSSKYLPCFNEFTIGYPIAEGYIYAANETFTLTAPSTTALVSGNAIIYQGQYGPPSSDLPMGSATLRISKIELMNVDGQFMDVYAEFATTTTDADGNWSIELPEGRYQVACDGADDYLAPDGNLYGLWVGETMLTVSAD